MKRAEEAERSRPRRSNSSFASTTIERPSGVSSGSDESCAASASSRSLTPGTGRKRAAWRLPSVIVPVLSSSSTETSPAASTARPDVASTLRRTRRFMPAMPMAESSAPIVVGMSETKSAASTASVMPAPARCAIGTSDAHTTRKIRLMPASRIESAISFGVRWRSAPSTSAIMRSRNVSPGLAVTRTTMRSLSTRVPPVTPERSPPASRITGADSPVTADSSTEAMPSTISPSAGITSPASQTTRSPARRSGAGPRLLDVAGAEEARDRRRAGLAQALGLGLAAALGERLGEVREEHGQPEPDRDLELERDVACALRRCRRASCPVTSTETTHDREDHGIAQQRARDRACERRRAALRERSPDRAARWWRWSPEPPGEGLGQGAESEGGEEGEGADEQDHADQEADEDRRGGRHAAAGRRPGLLRRERAGERRARAGSRGSGRAPSRRPAGSRSSSSRRSGRRTPSRCCSRPRRARRGSR